MPANLGSDRPVTAPADTPTFAGFSGLLRLAKSFLVFLVVLALG
jgi:hypothetical protein